MPEEGISPVDQQRASFNPIASEHLVKQQRLNQVAADFQRITDRLGMPIDRGIFDTVVTFNVLGINTAASCEGHLHRGYAAPWIDIEARETPELLEIQRRVQSLKRAIDTEPHTMPPTEKTEQLLQEYHALRREARRPHLEEARKVMPLLDEFYRERRVPADRRLIIEIGSLGGRMRSQGSELEGVWKITQETAFTCTDVAFLRAYGRSWSCDGAR